MCPTFEQATFTQKPGTLYRIALNAHSLIDKYFPRGCRESYFIVNDTGKMVLRGGHVHNPNKKGLMFSKSEVMVALRGSAVIHVHSLEGCGTITIESPLESVLIPPGVFHFVELMDDSILFVHSSVTIAEDVDTSNEQICSCKK